ncbi:hypothetical protein QEZ52_21315 (plasmid) [Aliisedimentitalea scapharcae]|uniref:Uncharacterized protein n=1 Tax=Aliisedimentitalea scapharcae TaxID=1524259 RepID=A0ABZ2Y1Z1_9RHOB
MNKRFMMMMEETWAGACREMFPQSGTIFQEISNGTPPLWPSHRHI